MKPYELEIAIVEDTLRESGIAGFWIANINTESEEPHLLVNYPNIGGHWSHRVNLGGKFECVLEQFIVFVKKEIEKSREKIRMELGDYEKFFCAMPDCKAHVDVRCLTSDARFATGVIKTLEIPHFRCKSVKYVKDDVIDSSAYVIPENVRYQRTKVLMPGVNTREPVWFCDRCAREVVRQDVERLEEKYGDNSFSLLGSGCPDTIHVRRKLC